MIKNIYGAKNKKKLSNYDKKMFRLVFILNQLNKGGSVIVKKLAEEFNVSVRTVERDISLLEQAGFYLDSFDKGKYKFSEGISLDRITLTSEEATIISIIKEMTASLGEKFENSFNSIRNKILSANQSSPYFVKLSDGIKLKEDFNFIEELENSIKNSKKIKAVYKKVNEDTEKEYLLKPLKIVFYDGFWYLVSYSDSSKLIKLRLDNISSIKTTADKFIPPDNLMQMLENSVNIFFTNENKIKVVLAVDSEASDYFKKKKIFPEQLIIEEKNDKSIIIESKISIHKEIIPLVLNWMPYVKVLEPAGLALEIKKTLKNYISQI